MIESNSASHYTSDLALLMKSNDERLAILTRMQEERNKHHGQDDDFCTFINKIQLLKKHVNMVKEVSQGRRDLKRLCIKYKDIDHKYIEQLLKSGICWKYIIHLLKGFEEMMNIELSWPIKNFESFGDVDFCEVFCSRLLLLHRIVDQFIELFHYGSLANPEDLLQLEEDNENLKNMDKVVIHKTINNMDKFNSQYLLLGALFKLFKISTHHAQGSLVRMALNFPYYALFANKRQRDLNLFLSDPDEGSLSTTWNFASTNKLMRTSLQLIESRIGTKRDVFFRKAFPEFTVKDLEKGIYQKKIDDTLKAIRKIEEPWMVYQARDKNDKSLIRATVLSAEKTDPNSNILPLSQKANHTVVLYAGGGGFLANLQVLQETFLKKWAINTGVTVFEAHYSLCPEFKYPYQTNELFNLYMQIIIHYKEVQKVKDLKVILMGDSAGGNLIMSLMNMLAAVDVPMPSALQLIYPPTDLRANRFSPSMLFSMQDELLYFTIAKACFSAYVPKDADFQNDWLLSPYLASDKILQRYPKSHIYCGDKDTLHDDCLRMVLKLDTVNPGQHHLVQIAGLFHGFLGFKLPLGVGVAATEKLHEIVQDYLAQDL